MNRGTWRGRAGEVFRRLGSERIYRGGAAWAGLLWGAWVALVAIKAPRSPSSPGASLARLRAAPRGALTAPALDGGGEVAVTVVPDVVVAESGPRVSCEREHVPAAVRREVYDREEGCCTFVGDDGHECGLRYAVQLHHRIAWAHGGSNRPENLTSHCGPHNRLVATREGLGRRPHR